MVINIGDANKYKDIKFTKRNKHPYPVILLVLLSSIVDNQNEAMAPTRFRIAIKTKNALILFSFYTVFYYFLFSYL